MRFDMLFREHWAAGRNSADQRQTHLLTQRILELYASRGTWHKLEHALLLQRPQVLLGGIR